MNRIALALAGIGLSSAALASGCGPSGSGSLGAAPTGSPRVTATASASPPVRPPTSATPSGSATSPGRPGSAGPPPSNGRTLTFTVWFVRDGRLFPAPRTEPATLATARLSLTTLVAGPTGAEAAAGVTTPIATGTGFDVALSGGVATVDLPASFYAGGRDVARLRQAQVVYTLTQYPTITKIGFQKDGAATGWPLGRGDYADLLPAIVVTSPTIGQRVASPVTVAGTADVFEATVSMRILDAAGAEIATSFTTATCGTGCRGRYSVALRYQVGGTQRGTVEVYSISAKDGSRLDVVRIPVLLTR